MKEASPVVIARKDYQPCNWTIVKTDLVFELDLTQTLVHSTLHLQRLSSGPLQLDGQDLALQSVSVDGQPLDSTHYTISDTHLQIDSLPDTCQLNIVTKINPTANTALEGLYCSSNNFTTQCEAEGFRKITYYLDRPDVLSVFSVRIVADQNAYPVLLSNGNLESARRLGDGRHEVQWLDPFPKPCYLFALVAGKLARIEDTFITRSKRTVDLHIYVEEHNIDQCDYAMDALKRSMAWDEKVYGLEYDLDLFMIVAVDDFNAGAMENKGLNIFNSKYVLADTELATDDDFLGVEAVIAHEYFHNWTGNRVTCRDWFQLSLKEGLTVFRDQEFSSDMQSREVKRIQDVRMLRAQQFAEDASPMSHPIRPDEYIEINNFYTLTVYEKGAEVIRMIHTVLGLEKYHAGIDLYFERHDGQAVTCDDFVQAMEDASGIDLSVFRQWYSQSGTPRVQVTDKFDHSSQQYTLTVTQQNPDRNGNERPPTLIPISLGLLDATGNNLPLTLGRHSADGSTVLNLTERSQTFVFDNISAKPIPSLLRGFSAPVVLEYEYNNDALAFLLANDSDSFNRWEAGQRFAKRLILQHLKNDQFVVPDQFLDAYATVINDGQLDPGFKSIMLDMPGIKTVANDCEEIDIHAIDAALTTINTALATRFQTALTHLVENTKQRKLLSSIGERSLANTALSLLSYLPSEQWESLAVTQYHNASNMTDRVAALSALCDLPGDEKRRCVADFYERWSDHKLVVDKWFSLQATAQHDQVINDVIGLTGHEAFDANNPNRFRSLIGAFASANPVYFHAADGSGYDLVSDYIILLDSTNPQVAARLLSPFLQWRRFVNPQQASMQSALLKIASVNKLSPAVYELVTKALEA